MRLRQYRHRRKLLQVLIADEFGGASIKRLVRKVIRGEMQGLSGDAAMHTVEIINVHKSVHTSVTTNVWQVLSSHNDPEKTLTKAGWHFDYALELGWLCSANLFGLIDRAFYGVGNASALSLEQDRALIRLEDSRWRKQMTPESGTKYEIHTRYNAATVNVAITHPHLIERVIDIAISRRPETEDHFMTLLKSDAPSALMSGEL